MRAFFCFWRKSRWPVSAREVLANGSQCTQFSRKGQPWCRAHADPRLHETDAVLARLDQLTGDDQLTEERSQAPRVSPASQTANSDKSYHNNGLHVVPIQ